MKFVDFEKECSTAITKLASISEYALAVGGDNASRNMFFAKLNRANVIYQEISEQRKQLKLSQLSEENLDQLNVLIEQFDSLYDNIQAVNIGLTKIANPLENSQANVENKNNVQLPQIKLNKFSGNPVEWTSFYELFKSLIHDNSKLSKIEKFQYLVSALSDEPLRLVKHLPLVSTNYDIALDALQHRYDSKRLLISTYWGNLVNSPRATAHSVNALRSLLNTYSENIAALANYKVDLWDFTLFNWLIQKVDSNTQERFELQHSNAEIPTYENLYKFLTEQCKALESSNMTSTLLYTPSQVSNTKSSSSFNRKQFTHAPKQISSNSSLVVTNNPKQTSCFVCKGDHTIFKCDMFLNKLPRERYNFIKECKRCVNCFGTHNFSSCSSQSTCRICQKRHHTTLHFPSDQNTEATPTNDVATAQPHIVTNAVAPVTILLSTALISVCDVKGNFQTCRALIDNGSQVSIITEKCLNRLGLPHTQTSIPIQGIGQTSPPASAGIVACQITPLFRHRPSFVIPALILPIICNNVPLCHVHTLGYKHLSALPLADPDYGKPGEIDILLGADIYSRIIQPGIKYGYPGEPIAMKTIFGWILSGPINTPPPNVVNSFHISIDINQDVDLDATLKKFWELEGVPNKISLSPDDRKCEEIFLESHTRDQSGRYMVSLPFRTPNPLLGDSLNSARRRFLSLEARLNRDPALFQDYAKFMQDYLESGHMTPVNSQTGNIPSNSCYYIPHHCILKPHSTTTKLRVVFDASAKSSNDMSLNDSLFIGTKLQQDIVSLLLRFRIHKVVLIADIKQMYRQILVTPEHRNYQRILWRSSSKIPIQEFELNTVTYGVSAAPYLAIRTLLQLASDEVSNFPDASKILRTDTYVDDIVTGCQSTREAIQLYSQLLDLLKSGGFELRKWSSNDPVVLEAIPPSIRQTNCQSFDSSDSFQKVLGLHWNPTSDSFFFAIDSNSRSCTKRAILSEIARIFDPLGLLSPLTLFAKHLIQILWTQGLSWDDTPPADICSRWLQYKSELPYLLELQLPRRILTDSFDTCDLHGFCDASTIGYSAVVYFRIVQADGSVNVFFVCAKSKVAPLKHITIPRLELCAALLLSELVEFVIQTYSNILRIERVFAWSDSTVALTWIKSSPHQWKTFISNRVTQIQEKISPQNWYHVSGSQNPADCASRGRLPQELLTCTIWWSGPQWLQLSDELWPTSTVSIVPSEANLEAKPISLAVTLKRHCIDDLLLRFSSLLKIQGVLAYIRRFIASLRSKNISSQGPPTSLELHNALLIMIKHVQQTIFSREIKQVESNLPCLKPFRKLALFLDQEGVLRVGGRLRHSQESFEMKHPILLPQDHQLTLLLIQQYHNKYLHPGATTLHSLLVQQFWILSAKRAINRCISRCHRCSRHNPKPYTPLMADLPKYRVSEVKPFLHTGVDYAGPFTITFGRRRGGKTQKAYLCLFICLAIKALHLELVSDLSSEAFIAAFRRFVARRGQCLHLYSDNGTNFVGANRQLIELSKKAAGALALQWHFNPPSAPHFGGLWEAGVKSVKHHLTRTVGEQILTYEELNTVFHQIEAILNSRPLVPLSNDPNDLQALTPGHFLTMSSLTAPPDEDLLLIPTNRLSRWQLLQHIQQSFWKRWHKDYLHTLQQRSKWTISTAPPSIDTIVVIKQDHTPPLTWPLGRITKLHPGCDGQTRVATVRTAGGLLTRPLIKLCPLPTEQ